MGSRRLLHRSEAYGGGGPCEAWWRGRPRTRCPPPPPPPQERSPSPASPCRTRRRAQVLGRYSLFSTHHSLLAHGFPRLTSDWPLRQVRPSLPSMPFETNLSSVRAWSIHVCGGPQSWSQTLALSLPVRGTRTPAAGM